MAFLDVCLSNLVPLMILTDTLMGVTSLPVIAKTNKEYSKFAKNETDDIKLGKSGVVYNQGHRINHDYDNLLPFLSPNYLYNAPFNHLNYKLSHYKNRPRDQITNYIGEADVESSYPADLKRCSLEQLAKINYLIQNYHLGASMNRLIDCDFSNEKDFLVGKEDLYNSDEYHDEFKLSKSDGIRRAQREPNAGQKVKKRIFGMEVLDVVGQAVPTTTPISYTVKVIDSALLPPNYKAFKNYFTQQEVQGENENKDTLAYKESAEYAKDKQRMKANGFTDLDEINNSKLITIGVEGSNRQKSLEEFLAKLDRKLNGSTKSTDKNSVNSAVEDINSMNKNKIFKESLKQRENVPHNNDNTVKDDIYNYMDSRKNWKMLRWLQARMNQSG